VSIGGPARATDRLRLVFGIAGVAKGAAARRCAPMSPSCSKGTAHLRDQGDDKCTVDSLTQERVETLGPDTRCIAWWRAVSASGRPPD
jgi:hypothetical protein